MSKHFQPLWDGMSYREHQTVGIQWMLDRERTTMEEAQGGILADEMGLGKTIQMVALIKHAASKPGEKTLLITPVAVIEQWKEVIQKSGLHLFISSLTLSAWVRESVGAKPFGPQVYIIGYERALRSPSFVKKDSWTRLVYDEAHRLASGNTSTKLSEEIQRKHTWLLTATPIINRINDMKVLLRIIGFPESVKNFSLEQIKNVLPTFLLSRNMEQLRKKLPNLPPPAVYSTISLPFQDAEEEEFYKGIAGILTKRWKALDGDAGSVLEKFRIFMRLRQLSLHPQIYIAARKKALGPLYPRPDWPEPSTKFTAIHSLINKKEGGRWILFCHFHEEMNMLQTYLGTIPTVGRIQIYSGSLNATDKEQVLQKTKQPLPPGKSTEILLVQLQSGGVGLNLQHFNRIIFTGPWWTQAIMNQAVGRAVRIGQCELVHVYHIVLQEEEAMNIDALMKKKADEKGHLCSTVLACGSSYETLEDFQKFGPVALPLPLQRQEQTQGKEEAESEDPTNNQSPNIEV
jgi:SNF2 family DNA or RNA helicase